MQAIQQLTNTLGEQASLLAQDIPKRLLSRAQNPEDYLFGNVSGEFNYHFTFRLEGGGFFQTGVLVASAETVPGGMPVPLRCRWKRRVDGHPVELPGVTSNMYQVSADDVGTHICVEAEPVDGDEGYAGVAYAELGPFELDPATRRCLDNALGLGGTRFTARIPGDGQAGASPASSATGGATEVAIHAFADGVRVVPLQAGTERTNREVAVEYSSRYPQVIIHNRDTTKFKLVLNDSRSYNLVAPSRTTRDLIVLTIRCFHAKKYLPEQTILAELLPVAGAGSPAGVAATSSEDKLDACILLERLSKELNRAMQQKEVSEKVLRNTNFEKQQFQAQLMETISGFTEVIEGIQEQFGDSAHDTSPIVAEDVLQEQLRSVTSQNKSLEVELQASRVRLEEMRRVHKTAASSMASAAGEVQKLREEQTLLQARLRELSSSSATPLQRDQADHSHAHELKRWRQDVEQLHNEKEQLRRQLADAEKEKQELQDNFLYVKSQLDKVQMKQAYAAENPAGDGSEVHRHKQALDAVTEERNRLSVRLEAVLRECEKDKAYHEQTLDRLMTANSRLMEEKDRAAKEVAQISQLYAESVKQLQSPSVGGVHDPLAQTGIFRAESLVGDTNDADPEEVSGIQAQIAELDEQLARKEKENESLKARIRKLAVT